MFFCTMYNIIAQDVIINTFALRPGPAFDICPGNSAPLISGQFELHIISTKVSEFLT